MKKFPLDGSVFEEKDKLISLLKNILLFTAAIGGGAALIYLLYLAANAYAGTGVKFFYPRLYAGSLLFYSERRISFRGRFFLFCFESFITGSLRLDFQKGFRQNRVCR